MSKVTELVVPGHTNLSTTLGCLSCNLERRAVSCDHLPTTPPGPCQGGPRRKWSTPSISPAHPLHPLNSLVMYKTFPKTAYSSCIFHEAGPKLKHINMKISRSAFLKKGTFHKIPRDISTLAILPGLLSFPASSHLLFSLL